MPLMLPRLAALAAVILLLASAPMLRAEQTRAPRAQTTPIKVEMIAKGLYHPWALEFLPDGRLLVTERRGDLRIVSRDGRKSPPVRGMPKAHAQGQGGLLDVTLAPDFETSGEIFLSFSEPRDGGLNGTSVARGRLVLDQTGGGRLENVAIIFRQQPGYGNNMHYGSRIVFARDGTFYLTVGDRYVLKDEAQDPSNHLGKIMRLTRDGKPAPDNPKREGWQPEIWSIGHRNVQGADLHPDTGELWTAEHGARGGDEINIPRKGRNFGWPVITYGRDYSGAKLGIGTTKAGMEQPIYYWDPSIAPSGAAFYTGSLFPDWRGNLFVGALAGQHLARLVLDGERAVAEERLLESRGDRIRDVRQGSDGAIWVVTDDSDGQILRITPAR